MIHVLRLILTELQGINKGIQDIASNLNPGTDIKEIVSRVSKAQSSVINNLDNKQ
jgi:hypothetical protein